MMNVVRSNDMILGFPHDVAGFSLLQCMLAQRLGVKPGVYTHIIANAHIYDNHYDAAKEMIKRPVSHKKIKVILPKNSFERAEKKDHQLVEEISNYFQEQYKPSPPIKGLRIVL
jgi:thymidylate synthase